MTLKPLRQSATHTPNTACRWPLWPGLTITVCGEPGWRKSQAPKWTPSAVTSSTSS